MANGATAPFSGEACLFLQFKDDPSVVSLAAWLGEEKDKPADSSLAE